MCGICGYVGLDEPGLIERMSRALVHRGPDQHGHFVDREAALGHRRLSIIDLTSGKQPMASLDGTKVLVFNGEIYNYKELRELLAAEGHVFETSSDTEVLLRLWESRGPAALDLLNGMFAFAVFDRQTRELVLARDRVGIKPLYYLELPGRLLFASETKALLEYTGWSKDVRAHGIRDYLALRYVPGDRGLLREVKKLAPGHLLRFKGGKVTVSRYWSPPAPTETSTRSENDLLDEFEALLTKSVERRLVSDVSVGAYLSGGLDSSVLVALMSRIVDEPVRTFSVGFDYEHDELSEAAATAELLGCDHHELACRAEDVTLLPEIVYHSDDPLGDPISIPMFQLAREAKKQVTVILTGEGADEMLGGYLFHKVMWAAELYRRGVPGPIRRWVVEPILSAVPAWMLNVAFQYPAYLGKRGKQKAIDYLRLAGAGDQDRGYRHLISLFDDRDTESLYTGEFRERLRTEPVDWVPPTDELGSRFDQMLRLQFGHWLPDNMLLRQDKMSMASAIEGRVPYLDHELMEFCFRLPRSLRLRGLTGKYLLRKVAERVLPKTTAKRKKMPFYVPIENYFQQPAFVELMDDLLGEDSVRRRGIFRPESVAKLRDAMHGREFLFVKQAFSLMTLELWCRAFVDGEMRCAPALATSDSVVP